MRRFRRITEQGPRDAFRWGQRACGNDQGEDAENSLHHLSRRRALRFWFEKFGWSPVKSTQSQISAFFRRRKLVPPQIYVPRGRAMYLEEYAAMLTSLQKL